MAISLSKGQKVSLTKKHPGLKKVIVGLGWKANQSDGADYDLDVAAFMLGSNGKCQKDEDFIFYNNKNHPSGAVMHMGDNRTGGNGGDSDDEQILVDLTLVPRNIERIVFTVTIDQAERRNQNFGMVSDAYCRIVDKKTGEELIRYNLEEEASIETAVIMAELYKHDGEWDFNAIGNGHQGGLAGLCAFYGIDVE